jgi:putative membrane protein
MKIRLFAGVALAVGTALAQPPGSMSQPGGMTTRTPGINPNQPGMTNDTTQTKMRTDDKKFVRDAAMGGMTEIAMGKLATEKGSSDGVKQYGQKLVDDHTKANEEVKQVAGAQSIEVPDALDSKHQSQIDKLSNLSGPAFDKAFTKAQVRDHEEDVRAFQNEAQNGNNAAVKDFANKTLPTLQQHLSMAKDLSKGKMAANTADRSQ